MQVYRVTEKFVSINGEGRKAGELSCFVRFAGCNLCCNYCDTRWSCDPDAPHEDLSAEEIASWVRETGVKNVTLTGGEPMLQPEFVTLLTVLREEAKAEIEVETNGSISIDPAVHFKPGVFYTMDMKCPGSGMAEHNCYENLSYLRPEDVVKFVVSDREDLIWTKEKIKEYDLTTRCLVYISSVFGRITPAEIVDFMKENELNDVRLQLQLHKYIWDPKARGV